MPISEAIDETLTMPAPGWRREHRLQRAHHLERADDVDAVDAMEVVGVEAVEVLGGDELGRPGVVDQDVGAAEPALDLGREAAAIGVDARRRREPPAPSRRAARHSAATASAGAASRE